MYGMRPVRKNKVALLLSNAVFLSGLCALALPGLFRAEGLIWLQASGLLLVICGYLLAYRYLIRFYTYVITDGGAPELEIYERRGAGGMERCVCRLPIRGGAIREAEGESTRLLRASGVRIYYLTPDIRGKGEYIFIPSGEFSTTAVRFAPDEIMVRIINNITEA